MKVEGLWTSVWRFLLLASFSGIYFALVAVILRPSATQAKSDPFDFPEQIPLSDWLPVDTESIEDSDVRSQGQRYRYLQNERTLTVELWYGRNGRACQRLLQQKLASSDLITSANQKGDQAIEDQAGNVRVGDDQVTDNQVTTDPAKSVQAQTVTAYPSSVHQTADGSYKYINQKGEDSIQAVIDARGETVVTHEQFIRNRYQYFLRPSSMLRWLIGQESITGDHDCFLTELSMPTEPTSAVSTPSLLKSTWQDLSQWGQAQL